MKLPTCPGWFTDMRRLMAVLHTDERGAEGLEKLLIFAAIIIPLLGVLILFRDRIQDWVSESWNTMRGQASGTPPQID